jgi:hypothetical protein
VEAAALVTGVETRLAAAIAELAKRLDDDRKEARGSRWTPTAITAIGGTVATLVTAAGTAIAYATGHTPVPPPAPTPAPQEQPAPQEVAP